MVMSPRLISASRRKLLLRSDSPAFMPRTSTPPVACTVEIAIAAWLEAGTLALLLHRRVPGLRYGPLGRVALLTAIASAVATVVGVLIRNGLLTVTASWPTVIGLSVLIVAVSAAFSVAFLAAARALRIAELPAIVGLMVDALRRPRRS